MPKRTLITLVLLLAAVSLCRGARDFRTSLNIDYFKERAENQSLPPAVRITMYDSLIARSGGSVAADIYFRKAVLHEKVVDYNGASKLLVRLLEKLPFDSLSLRCKAMLHLGAMRLYTCRPGDALREGMRLIAIPKPDSLLYYDLEGRLLLAHLFSEATLYERATQMIAGARDVMRQMEHTGAYSPLRLANYHGRLLYAAGSALFDEGKYEEAYAELKKARQVTRDSLDLADIMDQIATIHMCNGEYAKALAIYADGFKPGMFHPNATMSLLNSVTAHILNGEPAKGRELLERHRDMVKAANGGMREHSALMTEYVLAMALGDTAQALASLFRAHHLLDSVSTEMKSVYVRDVDRELEAEALRQESDRLRSRNMWKIVLMVLMGVALAACALWGVASWRRGHRALKEVAILREELEKLEKRRQRDIAETAESLEARNRELAGKAMVD